MTSIVCRVSVASTVLFAGSAALAADGSSGCGVGWYLFKENSLVSSSLRSTTHYYVPNTFSMTSGTSNCAKHSIIQLEKRGLHFVEANDEALESEIAAGQGQLVQSLAATLGCGLSAQVDFASTLQAQYSTIYTDESATAADRLSRILQAAGSNEALRGQCSLIGDLT